MGFLPSKQLMAYLDHSLFYYCSYSSLFMVRNVKKKIIKDYNFS